MLTFFVMDCRGANAAPGVILLRRAAHRTGPRDGHWRTPTGWKLEGMLAGWTGLEPAASGVTGRRSNQLNYHPLGKPSIY